MTLKETGLKVDNFVRSKKRDLRRADFVVGVSRGGLIPAALIAARMDKPLVVVYIDQNDRVYLDRKSWIRGKRVLLVDDIVRTGFTLKKIIALLLKYGVREIETYTIFCLRSASVRPTWTTLINKDKKMPWDI